jgi:hypothetical protein
MVIRSMILNMKPLVVMKGKRSVTEKTNASMAKRTDIKARK